MNKKVYFMIFAVSTTAFLLIAAFYPGMTGFNIRASEIVQSLICPPLTVFMIVITRLGEWYAYALVCAALCGFPKTRMALGIPATATLIVSAALNAGLKQLFALPRPDVNRLIAETGYTFPSGHAMNGAAFYGLCAVIIIGMLNGRKPKMLTGTTAALFVLLLGFSRIYLGVHYTADVAAGYVCGLSLACAALCVMPRNRVS